ncbi:hypothetical protein Pint_06731 [Pistacia integerrima]|uniref:Uncharacterized protein n=1 Tax=Pistacia integerrima TaxID=434235 RepID=A0ACC0XY56_9ROSI|nr:hypothetical protein Pint_06731 [Pistacia integerrima]
MEIKLSFAADSPPLSVISVAYSNLVHSCWNWAKMGKFKEIKKGPKPDVSEKGKAGSRSSFEVDLPDAEIGKVRLCFAPEPSGYLHIGHSKAAILNQYLPRDIETLGIKYEEVTYASGYFPELMEMAENLIRQGKAYVDDTPREQMQKEGMDGIRSKCRSDNVEEFLKEMISGSERGLQCYLRGKLHMQDPNKSLRDPVYYRCNPLSHHHIGSKYKLYPKILFCMSFVDAKGGIKHAP